VQCLNHAGGFRYSVSSASRLMTKSPRPRLGESSRDARPDRVRRMAGTLERLVLLVALAAAGVAAYVALDARSDLRALRAEASGTAEEQKATFGELEAKFADLRPTLVVQQRSDDPFEAPRAAADGQMARVSMTCDEGAVAVGGGFQSFDGVSWYGSIPVGGIGGQTAVGDGWAVQAVNENGGPGRVNPYVLCARGEGGLRVRSTAAPSTRARKGP
jgi:hypothetical protein